MAELPHRTAREAASARDAGTPPTPAYCGLFLEPRFPEHLIEDDLEGQD
ncbi:hypothetical protein [Streptomyces sp. NPDC058092]